MKSEARHPKGKLKAKAESQQLINAYDGRAQLVITNAGSVPVYLALGPTAVAEEGPVLQKESAPLVLEGWTGPVSVITKEGESLVTFAEY